jgi:integrase
MASVTMTNGRAMVRLRRPDGTRPAIYLGRMNRQTAAAFAQHLDALALAQDTGQPLPAATAAWVAGLGEDYRAKLARHGLVQPRPLATLDALIESFIASKHGNKPGTHRSYLRTRKHLLNFFRPDARVRTITADHAQRFAAYLVDTVGLAEHSTARKTIGISREMFRHGLRGGTLDVNPFDGLAAAVRPNPDKQYDVTPAITARIDAACPDVAARLLFALGRWGGLRIPSEVRGMVWDDVKWDADRLWVRSPKTEHHVGGQGRFVPLFPELRSVLADAFELAEPGDVYVLPDHLRLHANPSVWLKRLAISAGVEPWCKPWVNLRSTRETELLDRHPVHAVCKWIGNSPAVAMRHYAQVQDRHFAAAVAAPTHAPTPTLPGAEKAHPKAHPQALPKAHPHLIAADRNRPPQADEDSESRSNTRKSGDPTQKASPIGEASQNAFSGPGWIPTCASTRGKTAKSDPKRTQKRSRKRTRDPGSASGSAPGTDPATDALLTAWADLDEEDRRAVLDLMAYLAGEGPSA